MKHYELVNEDGDEHLVIRDGDRIVQFDNSRLIGYSKEVKDSKGILFTVLDMGKRYVLLKQEIVHKNLLKHLMDKAHGGVFLDEIIFIFIPFDSLDEEVLKYLNNIKEFY